MRQKLAEKILEAQSKVTVGGGKKCFIGFDGFTDEIISVVDKRRDRSSYLPLKSVSDFGKRILDAAGKSCNLELVLLKKKLGGNAPIMTNALLLGGHSITFSGTIGNSPDRIEPIFQEMAERCEKVIPLGPSAHTDALEFSDGKILLGKMDSLQQITIDTLLEKFSIKELIITLDQCELFACCNWTMLPIMSELWHYIKSSVVPHLSMKSLPRWLFVDLADPAKRDDKDLIEAIEALADLQPTYNVILGLNKAEALRLLKTLGREGLWEDLYEDQAEEAVEWIRKKTTFSQVIIHFAHFAVVSAGFATFNVKGPFCADPVLTTGGGDNFNGGFCNGLLYGFDIEESLLTAVATSGFYVRFGSSPTMMELADFLKDDRYWNNY